jgi:hypothetical protein
MADQKDSGEQTAEQATEATAIEINSVNDIAGHVDALAQDGVTGATARSYTAKGGFRNVQSLVNTSPDILATMAGSIFYALAEQAANGDERAQQAMDLSIEYAENVGSLKANSAKLRTYCVLAIDMGYGEGDVADLDIHEQAAIVTDFLSAQKPDTMDKELKEFQTWVKETAKTSA